MSRSANPSTVHGRPRDDHLCRSGPAKTVPRACPREGEGRTEEGKLYPFVAIDRTSKLGFAAFQIWTKEPERFKLDASYHISGMA